MYDLSAIVKANDIRGLVGSQIDATVTRALGAAFASAVLPDGGSHRTVVVGHDMRDSSPELAAAFADGVTSAGPDVVMIGLCSTDGLYYASGATDSPGVMFTASHNPADYNGLKLCRSGARPIGLDSGLDSIRDIAQGILDLPPAPAQVTKGSITTQDLLAGYARHLRNLVPTIGQRPLKIVVDAGNGMGGLTVPAVLGDQAGLAALPIEVVPLYFELDGTFPNHEANPLDPENLRDLQKAVPEHGADLGLAFDGDADRCFVVDERGTPISPSAITALVAAREIAKEKASSTLREGLQPVVIHNLITSRAVPEVIAENGAQAIRTRVGHSFIKVEMAKADAVFGGEHSAHYYFRDFWFADTGMLAALHVMAALGEQDEPLSALVAGYERYVPSGEINSVVKDVEAATERVVAAFEGRPGIVFDHLDGLTVSHEKDAADGDGPHGTSWPGLWWFNLRPSNTEPLLRLNAEAASADVMAALRDEVLALVRA